MFGLKHKEGLMKYLLLIILVTGTALASENLSFNNLIGKSYEVASFKVKAKDANLKKVLSGLKTVRFIKDEVNGDLKINFEVHDNSELINADLISYLARADVKFGANTLKEEYKILWCRDQESKVKEKKSNKIQSVFLDETFFFCIDFFGIYGGKTQKSKISIKLLKNGNLKINSIYKTYGKYQTRRQNKKRVELILK